jgi:COMPASS component SWD3
LWSISDVTSVDCIQTLKGHEGDVYTVQFHPGQNHIVSGGYDKIIRLFDVRSSILKKSFVGHNSSISSAIFNPLGNLIISGYLQ